MPVKPRPYKKVNSALLTKLWFSRASMSEICGRMGHHDKTLRRAAEKLGLPKSRTAIWNGKIKTPPQAKDPTAAGHSRANRGA